MTTSSGNRSRASIIIANYNYGRFLKSAIESALGQTWTRTEVIVVDDGSTDESLEILAQNLDRVIPVIKDNGGQASAFNAGFERSGGDVVYFLDSDDILERDCVEKTIGMFEDPSVVKAHWPMTVVNAGDMPTGEVRGKQLPSGYYADKVVRLGPANHQTSPTSANAWSRWVLERVMPIPEAQIQNSSDSYLFALVPFHGALRCVDQPLTRYRIHENNVSGRRKATELIRLWEDRATMLQSHLADYGIEVAVADWRQRNAYLHRLQGVATIRDIIHDVVRADQVMLWLGTGLLRPDDIASERGIIELQPQSGGPVIEQHVIETIDDAMQSGASIVGLPGSLYRKPPSLDQVESHLRARYKVVHDSRELLLFGPR